MPLVKIEIAQGRELTELLRLKELVMSTVVDVLQLPTDDRNIRISEYRPEFFSMKAPYEILVEIILFSGRTIEIKKRLYQQLAENLENHGICPKENVFIVLNEQPMENWGVRGGKIASELKLNFKVDI